VGLLARCLLRKIVVVKLALLEATAVEQVEYVVLEVRADVALAEENIEEEHTVEMKDNIVGVEDNIGAD
jgi:hypothetical protein